MSDFNKRTKQYTNKVCHGIRKKKRKEQKKKRELALAGEARIQGKNRCQEERTFDKEAFFHCKSTFAADPMKDKSMRAFERRCKKVHHKVCLVCRRTSINLKMSKHDLCTDCKSNKYTDKKLIKEGMLPVWFDENHTAQYRIPDCLSCLSDCEKMLIQKLNTHVPAHHLKYGVVGIKGHVCAFPQEISQVCSVLPRLPSDCSVVRYVKEMHSRVIGEQTVRLFRIRRSKVLAALHWLKVFHIGYQDITISESNMEWMKGAEEVDLPLAFEDRAEDLDEMEDKGPSPIVNVRPCEESDYHVTHSGFLVEDSPVIPSEGDREIAQLLESTKPGGEVVLSWPSVSDKAVSELTDEKIFPLAFPWLFPGGIGDVKDFRERNLPADEWARRLIMYEDARFATDKIFCFYVLNYCVRRRNRSSSNFFVNKFSSVCSGDVESLR